MQNYCKSAGAAGPFREPYEAAWPLHGTAPVSWIYCGLQPPMTKLRGCGPRRLSFLVILYCCCGIQAHASTARRQLQQSQEYFNELNLKLSRDTHAQYLKKARPQVDVSRPQGIVIPAGGPVLLRNAAALVKVIREHYDCQLPIEIFYQGQQEWHEAAGSSLKVNR